MGHDIEPITQYCRICGCSEFDALVSRFKCDELGNVTGISHIVALKRLKGLVREVASSAAEQPRPA